MASLSKYSNHQAYLSYKLHFTLIPSIFPQPKLQVKAKPLRWPSQGISCAQNLITFAPPYSEPLSHWLTVQVHLTVQLWELDKSVSTRYLQIEQIVPYHSKFLRLESRFSRLISMYQSLIRWVDHSSHLLWKHVYPLTKAIWSRQDRRIHQS